MSHLKLCHQNGERAQIIVTFVMSNLKFYIMEKKDLEIGYIVQTNFCYGYSNVQSAAICIVPAMIVEVTNILEDQIELAGISKNPKTYVHLQDIQGVPLNSCILDKLGFTLIDKTLALCPAPGMITGQVFEATIDNTKIQIIQDGNKYELCMGSSRSPLGISFVHEIQKNKTTNGKPLKINPLLFDGSN